jgi:hypothetical protein
MNGTELIIDGKKYQYIKTRNQEPVSVYKGDGCFLRIGPKKIIQEEIDFHKNLLRLGFPIAELLQSGEHEGLFYFTEVSLGENSLSSIFKENFSNDRIVSDNDFEILLNITRKYLEAELRTVSQKVFEVGKFEKMIHLDFILEELPLLKDKTSEAMKKAEENISRLPIVLSHGDFNPYNIFPKGVIDWERAGEAPLGYDITTNISQFLFFPVSGDFERIANYNFSNEQISKYWAEIDKICISKGFPKISDYFNDFLFTRCIWSVVRMHKTPKLQKWRNVQYEKLLDVYLNGGNVAEFLIEYRNKNL